ncbi:unnamed protein product [Caenorhabditis angaria]|uniref:Protein kinase domain-containing protein n=1 Tax=Caenorhabditis angaria TaxID=860376 RepID=A0A9P1IJB4_9PELO|nr:unnamed protein product [Caenorhabditis angaria]
MQQDKCSPFYSIPRFGENEPEKPKADLLEQEKNNAYIKSVYDATMAVFESDKSPKRILEKKEYSTVFPKLLITKTGYQVVEILNCFDPNGYLPAMARVESVETDKLYFAKVQMRKPIEKVSGTDHNILLRELYVLGNWIDKPKEETKYLTKLADCGFDDNFRFILIEDAFTNLKILQNSRNKMPRNFVFLLTYHSFQAVKQLHQAHFMHCDLHPACFTISPPFSLKIKNFYRASFTTSTRNLVIKKLRTTAFSSRKAYKIGEKLELLDDYENWFHVIMHATCKNGLPWKEETADLQAKEKFYELLDADWFGSADMLCLIPHLLKKYRSVRKFESAVDELFSINVKMFDKNEAPDWGFFVPEEKPKKSTRKKKIGDRGRNNGKNQHRSGEAGKTKTEETDVKIYGLASD